ncbi:putative membrane protein YphA (DoxX/SURF4 family) [Flavobacteriaceae bacterium MAR_2010_72]|nr:putative membrane protein YphA (DoxX/SURF4 family) [Flavobacteriaceae bacterium MAR_2010_72]
MTNILYLNYCKSLHHFIMGKIKSLNKWANAHTYLPLDILRMALGVFLFMKGINFMGNSQMLVELFAPFKNMAGGMIMIHYVAPAHFIGGILIVFGLLTRWAIIGQLPILIGAIAINFAGEMDTTNLLLASITFLVCVFFLFYGSGKRSADYYFKMQQ